MIDHRYFRIWSYGKESIIKVFVANTLFTDPFSYVLMADKSIYCKAPGSMSCGVAREYSHDWLVVESSWMSLVEHSFINKQSLRGVCSPAWSVDAPFLSPPHNPSLFWRKGVYYFRMSPRMHGSICRTGLTLKLRYAFTSEGRRILHPSSFFALPRPPAARHQRRTVGRVNRRGWIWSF